MEGTTVANIPVEKGLNGCFSGIHNGLMIIAGGANFPDKDLWEGGKKVWYDTIYALQSDDNGYHWVQKIAVKLPRPIGYGVSVSTDNGIICIGGDNGKEVFREVFRLSWDSEQKNIVVAEMPELPVPLCNMSSCVISNVVYVVGGQQEIGGNASNTIFALDLSVDATKQQWESLGQFPGVGRTQAVVVGQNNGTYDCLYVMSGASFQKDASPNTVMLSDVHEYNIQDKKWTKRKDVPTNYTPGLEGGFIGAAPVLAMQDTQILVFGGAGGEQQYLAKRQALELEIKAIKTSLAYPQKALLEKEEALQKESMALLRATSFSRILWSYDTKNDEWTKAGSLPSLPQIVTNALVWEDEIYLPLGEIRPGVRTSGILKLTI
ncbi:cyclically-permuted mutarotase family protein [Arenibacter nanhaiticus]|uniref:Cyclically-permuted mutarotase family protein n=1 Tax=Arenibacter nanhaiticus TaxID=558155 RepID=A0A1M6GC22_9FLAO|nr:kelch repeat-containing protein [Arenibacter nanhaiticus]SHJ07469.1 cyclically-permuted mutarotase family protein [Arenibacter nanhaiticus]